MVAQLFVSYSMIEIPCSREYCTLQNIRARDCLVTTITRCSQIMKLDKASLRLGLSALMRQGFRQTIDC